MKRVGFVLAVLDQSWIGGLNYYKSLISAIQELPARQIEPVLFIGKRTPLALLKDFPPVESVQLGLLDRWSFLWVLRKVLQRLTGNDYLLERALKKHGVVVLSHFSPLGKKASIKTMGWIQDFQHRRLPEFFSDQERARRDAQFADICRACDVVLLSSHAAQADLKAFMPECTKKSRVLQFVPDMKGSEQITSIEEVRKKYGIPDPYFHLPNQFWRHKNHTVVVEAMHRLKQDGKKVTVVCTGNTTDHRHPEYFKSLMQTVEKYGLTGQFKVLGVVPFADLIAIMRNSLALINPSLFEGWSTTVEESKLLGKTLLLSGIDVHIEQAPEKGQYFDPHDARKLADLMDEVVRTQPVDTPLDAVEQVHARMDFAERYQQIVLEAVNHV